jgi:hypothetical protein
MSLSDRYEKLTKESNPVVFLDVSIGSHEAGRIVIEVVSGGNGMECCAS